MPAAERCHRCDSVTTFAEERSAVAYCGPAGGVISGAVGFSSHPIVISALCLSATQRSVQILTRSEP